MTFSLQRKHLRYFVIYYYRSDPSGTLPVELYMIQTSVGWPILVDMGCRERRRSRGMCIARKVGFEEKLEARFTMRSVESVNLVYSSSLLSLSPSPSSASSSSSVSSSLTILALLSSSSSSKAFTWLSLNALIRSAGPGALVTLSAI